MEGLREDIYRVFHAVAAGGEPAEADLALLRGVEAEAIAHGRLAREGEAFAWTWTGEPPGLGVVTWRAAHSAVSLLTSPELGRVRECPGWGDCGWLFLDGSKNGSRRWCSMEVCGSRAKMRRLYARQRGRAEGGSPAAGR